jgi:hypothetical protein
MAGLGQQRVGLADRTRCGMSQTISRSTMAPAGSPAVPDIDATWVISRLEEAGRTLMCLPNTGPSPRLRSSSLEVLRAACELEEASLGKRLRLPIPSAARIGAMDEALGWLGLIPNDRYVLRRIVGARSLVDPRTDRHLFSWRRLGGLLSADHRAVQRWHGEGIGWILIGLSRTATVAAGPALSHDAPA